MAHEIVQHWASALGGRERLEKIESMYVKAAIEMAGLSGISEEWLTSGGQRRHWIDLEVYKSLTVLDGRIGWTMGPNGNVAELGDAGLKREITSVYLGTFSHLIPGRMEGRIDYEGKDEAGDHVLQIEPAGGQSARFFIDAETWLPARMQTVEGGVTITFEMGDWREVNGVKFPFHQKQTTEAGMQDSELTTQEITINAPPDPALFYRPGDMAAQVTFASGSEARGIPIELVNNHIYLEIRINDSEPIPFLLDTGAAMSVVSAELAQKLGLETKGQLEGQGAGEGSVALSLTEVSMLGVQGVEIPNQTFAVVPLAPFRAYLGWPIHGILGFNFTSRFAVEIEYAEKRINLYDPAAYTPRGEELSITLEDNIPTVKATIGLASGASREGVFLVDTGASLALNLNPVYAESHGLLAEIPGTIEAPGGFGVGGEVKARVGRIAHFRLGNTSIETPVVNLSQDTKGALANPDFAGVLGAEILRRFTVAFDYQNQRMVLETNRNLGDPFKFNMVGAFLIAAEPDYETFEVYWVIDGSPAQEAGVRKGDRLVEVDGRPASDFELHELHELFETEGDPIRLKLKRDDETLVKRLERRRML